MKFEDIFGLAKILPIDKLIGILERSVGRLTYSYFVRKDAQSKAYEIKAIAEARAEELKIMSSAIKENSFGASDIVYKNEGLELKSINEDEGKKSLETPSIDVRAKNREDYQRKKRQFNVEVISAIAADELIDKDEIDNSEVNEDWYNRFFRLAEDISGEEMQALWGKILAGEILKSRTFSLRTLDVVRNLTKEEANIFLKVGNFTMKRGESYLLFLGEVLSGKDVLAEFGITYSDIALMTEVGILHPSDFSMLSLKKLEHKQELSYVFGKYLMIITVEPNTSEQAIALHLFTTSGKELMRLIEVEASIDYIESLASTFVNDNVSVKYAEIVGYEGSSVRHKKFVEITKND